MNAAGFIKLERSPETAELVRDRNAFHLLALVALRARYSAAPSLHGLTFGQALVGDCSAVGMTRKEYRTAQRRLVASGLASFVGTPKGTIATLLDSRVFSLVDERKSPKRGHQKGQQISEEKNQNGAIAEASEGPTEGQQGATNQKDRRTEETESIPAALPAALDTDAFKAAWSDWKTYASARRLRRWVPQTVSAKLAELEVMGELAAIAAIRASIANGWASIYPPKGNAPKQTQPHFR